MQAYAANMKKTLSRFQYFIASFWLLAKQLKKSPQGKDSIFFIFLTQTWVEMS